MELAAFERRLLWVLERHSGLAALTVKIELEVMTAHKAKGKEADTVIVLDVTTRQFPKLHADNVLFQPFGVSVEDALAEERRLFYVAITRAQHRLLLVTETGQESLFIKELQLECGASDLEQLADGRKSETEPSLISEIGKDIHARIDAIDRWDLIIGNASQHSVPLLKRLRSQQYALPQVGYTIKTGSGEMCAEFAWPDSKRPAVILPGLLAEKADQWRDAGWNALLS